MKCHVFTAIALGSILFPSLLTSTAPAQGPRVVVGGPQVVIINNGPYGGYGGRGGYGAYGGNVYGNGAYSYGGYGGYAAPYYGPAAPYGAGYSGGWQPYQQMQYQRLQYGLGF